jgi:hypothetical protein
LKGRFTARSNKSKKLKKEGRRLMYQISRKEWLKRLKFNPKHLPGPCKKKQAVPKDGLLPLAAAD